MENDLPFRVLLVDEQPLFREGLRGILQDLPGFMGLREASSPEEALDELDRAEVDAVITELLIPEMKGMEFIGEVRRRHEDILILVLSISSESSIMLAAMDAGASGCLSRGARREEIQAAVQAIRRGENYLPPHLRPSVPPADSIIRLTGREREILRLFAQGANNQEVCDALCLSSSSVKSYTTQLLRKLSATSRTQLVVKAIQLRLVPDPPDPSKGPG